MPGLGDTSVLELRLGVAGYGEDRGWRTVEEHYDPLVVEFRALNLVSTERVTFIHFLTHIDGASIRKVVVAVHIGPGMEHVRGLNPYIFELLNKSGKWGWRGAIQNPNQAIQARLSYHTPRRYSNGGVAGCVGDIVQETLPRSGHQR